MNPMLSFWRNRSGAEAFEGCVAPHLERMWRLALRLQCDPTDAEDLVQELLARAWRRRDAVLALDAPGPWLAKALYRLHVDRWRRRGVLDEAEPLDADDALAVTDHAAERSALASAAVADMLDAVDTLPESHRVPLLMHDAEGFTLEEISHILNVPTGTLKSRLHRARTAVRKIVGDGT